MDYNELYSLGEYAKYRLIKNLTNVANQRLINIAVEELMMILSFIGTNTWEYGLSKKMLDVWKICALDTLFYKYFCAHSCLKYKQPIKIINMDHQIFNSNNESLLQHQSKTYVKYYNIFGKYPTRELWNDVLSAINTNRLLNNNISIFNFTFRRNNDNSETIPNMYTIKIFKLGTLLLTIEKNKDENVNSLFEIISVKETINKDNIKLIYNGQILSGTEILKDLFNTNANPKLHLIIRQ